MPFNTSSMLPQNARQPALFPPFAPLSLCSSGPGFPECVHTSTRPFNPSFPVLPSYPREEVSPQDNMPTGINFSQYTEYFSGFSEDRLSGYGYASSYDAQGTETFPNRRAIASESAADVGSLHHPGRAQPRKAIRVLHSSALTCSLPSHEETEEYFRKMLDVAHPYPLSLEIFPDDLPDEKPPVLNLIILAICGSPHKRLTMGQIFDEIENRFPAWKDKKDKPWQVGHSFSLLI
ncbi:hypothetical protein NLJ89_g7755 [Agrocybe chaxingu]|uniref:Fork-head domain-containing protein n=1 Tax=Agrocybe chaxingu TaxID=84603 RepID=A0A9W8JWJ5_9AGAR|nr:hypothetical protein NLJ89_g7755 [Agrocybe chaxingu]